MLSQVCSTTITDGGVSGAESEFSNTASASPIDTVKPILSHNVISTALGGSTVLVQANVTDNIGVQSVTCTTVLSGRRRIHRSTW